MSTKNLDEILVYLGSLVERTDKWTAQALPILGREVVLKGLISHSTTLVGCIIVLAAMATTFSYLYKKSKSLPKWDRDGYQGGMVFLAVLSLLPLGLTCTSLTYLLQHIFTPNAVLLDYVMTKLGK